MYTTDQHTLHTITSLSEQFAQAGLANGQTVLVHSSMKRIGGYIVGGAEAVILALLRVLGETGTLMMPTHTSNNTDPAHWQNPPVPQEWWQTIRDQRPAYHAGLSRTRQMGILPETLRTHPDAQRSSHPVGSFVAVGKHAADLTASHDLASMFGDDTPLSTLYDLDGAVFLLGVGHGNNTSLHLAEYRAAFNGKMTKAEGSAVLVDGVRQWVTYEITAWNDDDFVMLGSAYDAQSPDAITHSTIGDAPTQWMQQAPLVDFGITWLEENRPQSLAQAAE